MKFEKLSEKLSICVSEEHGFGTDAFLLTHFCEYKACLLYTSDAADE